MRNKIEDLKARRVILVRIIKERSDGSRYVPLVLRLEQEIEALEANTDHYLRIMNEAA